MKPRITLLIMAKLLTSKREIIVRILNILEINQRDINFYLNSKFLQTPITDLARKEFQDAFPELLIGYLRQPFS
jgi:hypothetical protein